MSSMICRPREHLAVAGRLYPDAWRRVDELRAGRGKDLPSWPDWCVLPLAGAYAIVSADAGLSRLDCDLVGDVGRMGALAAWRVTQGIYRFDPAVFDSVRETTLDGEIPCSVLYRLPEWCVYVETPGLAWAGLPLHGFWAHLEWDTNTGRTELRLLTDSDAGLLPIVLHIGPWTLSEAMDRSLSESMHNAKTLGEASELAKLAAQGGSQQGSGGQNIAVTINARDAQSFRQSRVQVASDIARAVAFGRRAFRWPSMKSAFPT